MCPQSMIRLQVHSRPGKPHNLALMFTPGQNQACGGAQDACLCGKGRPKAFRISDCQEPEAATAAENNA